MVPRGSNQAKATDALTNVMAKANFTSAKNPCGSSVAYQASPAGTVVGTVYLNAAIGNTMTDPVITVTGYYTDAKGVGTSFAKTVSVN